MNPRWVVQFVEGLLANAGRGRTESSRMMSANASGRGAAGEMGRDLLWVRVYYIMLYGVVGFGTPFLNLFYLSLGLKGTDIGWIGSVGALVALVSAPFWMGRAELWRHPRSMIQLILLAVGVGYLFIGIQRELGGVVLAVVFHSFVIASMSALSDALALRVTGAQGGGFGGVRVFGSLGWVIFASLNGVIVDATDYRHALWGAAAFTVISAAVLLRLPAHYFTSAPATDADGGAPPRATSAWANTRHALQRLSGQPLILATALGVVLITGANLGIGQFEGAFLRQLGASPSLIGLVSVLSGIVELPLMFVADYAIRRRSAYSLLLFAIVWYVGLRLLVFVWPSVTAIMLSQAGQGIGLSLYVVALVRLIGDETMPQDTRLMLAFINVTLPNLIVMTVGPVMGALFDGLGARPLYLIGALGYGAAWWVLRWGGAKRQALRGATIGE
jgi:MFS transporter, PPP family, 3-phenylpropionic acid transporter